MPAPSSLLLVVSLAVVVVSFFVVVVSSLLLLLAVSFPSFSSCRFPCLSLPPSRCIPPPPPSPRRCIHSSVPSLHTPPSCSSACRSLLSLYPLPSPSSACRSLSSLYPLPPFLLLYPHPPPHRVISLPRRAFEASHMLSMGRIRWVREVGVGSYVLGLTLIRRALWLSNLSRGCRLTSDPSLRRRIRPFVVESVPSLSNPFLRRRIRPFVVESVALRVRVGFWVGSQ
jgi:hypothetical protein